jgi:crotonobetainyl-CoA:carnitine CoA-transferase CaiB-like acyl-CoA transferase
VRRLPLEGVRVADLSHFWAGPAATARLAEMGAEVWKIESPAAWDNGRTLVHQPGAATPWESSYWFEAWHRDKKSVTLDIAQPRGRELFLRLVQHCDVVVENYRADVLDKLGIGWGVLRSVKPELVVVSMAAFGKLGPDAGLVGFGPVVELMSGLTARTGYGDGEPYRAGVAYGDPVAGMAAVTAIVLGLIQRRRTGEGCVIDLAQRETAAVMAGESFVAASLTGAGPVHYGNRSPRFAPQGCYRALPSRVELGASREEQWLVVSCRDDEDWASLAGVLGRSDMSGMGVDERRGRHDELDELIGGWAAGLDAQDAMELLQAAGVPAGRVLDSGSVLDDPHLLRRGFWVYLPHPRMRRHKQFVSTWRFVEANPQLRRHAPLFGENNREVLGGVLGLSEEELAALSAANVIGDRPINPGVG